MISLWDAVQIAAEVYEPDDAVGLAGLFVIGLPALVTAVLSGVVLYRQRENSRSIGMSVEQVRSDVGDVKDQVKNGHTTPMRADMDDIGTKLDRIDAKVDKLGRSHAELCGEVKGLTHRVDRLTEQ